MVRNLYPVMHKIIFENLKFTKRKQTTAINIDFFFFLEDTRKQLEKSSLNFVKLYSISIMSKYTC